MVAVRVGVGVPDALPVGVRERDDAVRDGVALPDALVVRELPD